MYIDLSGTYTIKEVFDIGGIVSIANEHLNYLMDENCNLENKRLADDRLELNWRRESDGLTGTSFVKINSNFSSKPYLLKNLYRREDVMHKTLSEIRNMEIKV